MTGAVRTEFFRNMEGGHNATLPRTSAYLPIQKQVETMMGGSLSGSKGHDRLKVTNSTVAVLLNRFGFTTRYIRRGYGAIMIWLMHMLFPAWLIDRWARQSGSLDKLKKYIDAR